jgi:VWA domain-containing protein/putative Flp pilus-assembly TadE/G-like protein
VKKRNRSEAGAVLIAVTLFLLVMLGFAAAGTEAGRWFLVRAELSKSVDSGALAGARNLSNPHVDPSVLAAEFGQENFQSGYLGTPGSGQGSVTFDVQLSGGDKVRVDGRTSAVAILGKILGFDQVPVSATGVAQMRKVEIMLILDRSGSMNGQPMADLKVAAKSFIDFFTDTQTRDRMGMISFATGVIVNHRMGTNYVTTMKQSVDAMQASGHTNPEDALDQANGPLGFADQSAIAPAERIQQFAVFFSDGRPNTFRGTFKKGAVTYDATAFVNGNCDPGDVNVTNATLYRTDVEQPMPVIARPTGPGVFPSPCLIPTTKWNIFNTQPVPGYAPNACNIPDPALGNYVCGLAAAMAVQKSQELKNSGIIVFSIGLGERINSDFLRALATGPEQVYIAPTSDQLASIFQKVAQDIKLRLVM